MSTITMHGPLSTGRASTGRTPSVRLRLTRRGRAVLAALVALPLAIGIGCAALNGGGAVATSDHAPASFSYVTVGAGDSLWGIAERVAPSSDPRDVIAAIMDLNGLDSPDVAAGERLAIPSAYTH